MKENQKMKILPDITFLIHLFNPKAMNQLKKNVLPSHAESPYLTNCIRIL